MKRVGNIYEKIIQLGNIESAVMHAAKGKSKRKKRGENIRFPNLLCYASSKDAKRTHLYSIALC